MFSVGEPGFSLLDMKWKPPIPQDRIVVIGFRDTENDSWSLNFNPNECESDLVTVTRMYEDTWEFVPGGDEIACLKRSKNGRSGPPILQGLYKVPFRFTVTLLD